MELGGLHHVTAVTGNAQSNARFYTQVLGLRLVKKTVNQDDVSAYHLFYGNAIGSPGTEVTFFDWPRLPARLPGSGTIGATTLRVTGAQTITWWSQRLAEAGLECQPFSEFNGRRALAFSDPEGQQLVLVDDGGAPGAEPWEGGPVPAAQGIRGLHAVKLVVRQLEPSALLLTEVLGFRQAGSYEDPTAPGRPIVVFEVGTGGPGAEVHIAERPEQAPGFVGIGGVHHVAFRTANEQEQLAWRDRIAEAGLGVTDIIDRFYFRSIYFREPGGILFEIATDGPGFTADEDAAHLGERLSLPPFLEPYRARIEARLRPIPV